MSYPKFKLDRSFYQSGIKDNPTLKTELFESLMIWSITEPKPELLIWRGKQSKPFIHYTYRQADQMQITIDRAKDNETSRNAFKARMKEENKGKKSEHAYVAELIRKELKQAYPTVKFKVKSDSFSGGDSVHVTWVNGVTDDQVNAIVRKYSAGHFDGMDDCYYYNDEKLMVTPEGKIEKLPTSKYVSAQRTITDDVRLAIAQKICQSFGLEWEGKNNDELDYILWAYNPGMNAVYRVYNKIDFTKVTLEEVSKLDLCEYL